jgi:DNA-directed RNA polymerase alpha subunit
LNALRSRQIERVGQVMTMERDQLLSIRNFGPRSLRELTDALAQHGYAIPSNLSGADDVGMEDVADMDGAEVAVPEFEEETGS